jgi:hypothetical protein
MAKFTINQARNITGSTDWKIVEALSDQEVTRAALSDPDARPLSKYELTQLKPLKFIRHKLGL